MDKSFRKNIRKCLSGKYSQRLIHNAKKSATDALKTTSKRVIQKTKEATGGFRGNKVTNRTTKVSKNSQQNNSETVRKENNKERPKETYLSPEKKTEIYIRSEINTIV